LSVSLASCSIVLRIPAFSSAASFAFSFACIVSSRLRCTAIAVHV
jgi:hypothetical protein